MITNTVFVFDCVPFIMLAGFCIHFFSQPKFTVFAVKCPNLAIMYLY